MNAVMEQSGMELSILDQLDLISASIGEAFAQTTTKRLAVVEPDLDTPWLDDLRNAKFEPTLLTANFDAVQMVIERSDVHLVLLAQNSLMMDGISACRLLRQSRTEAQVAVVVMLDSDFEGSMNEAYSAGAADVLCRPFGVSELLARLEHAERNMVLAQIAEATARQETPRETSKEEHAHSDTPIRRRRRRRKTEKPIQSSASRNATSEWLAAHPVPAGMTGPLLDTSRLKFVSPLSDRALKAAAAQGSLNEVLLDKVWMCPQCQSLPSFRPGCPCCGSARVTRDELMHHFACAFVGGSAEFTVTDEGLSCPKCCAQRLMVGTDSEYLSGPWRCQDCDWSPAELEVVGHCLKCGLRFPSHQASLKDLVGHYVDGLAPLADGSVAN